MISGLGNADFVCRYIGFIQWLAHSLRDSMDVWVIHGGGRERERWMVEEKDLSS